MKRIFLVALAAIGMTACMQDEVVEIANGGAIAFDNAFVGNATRAESVTTANLDAFKVWGYVGTPSGVVFDGTEVKGGNGIWKYDGTQYWMPNNPYWFAAVAPVLDENAGASWEFAMEDGQSPRTLTFNTDGKTDLVYAHKEVAAADTYNNVAFQFEHLLSKVKFSFTTNLPTGNVVSIKDLKITTVATANIDLNDKVWTPGNAELVLTPALTNLATEEYFIVPATCKVEFDVVIKVGDVTVYNQSKTATLAADSFVMGHAYNLCAEINPNTLALDEIVFNVDKVTDWEGPHSETIDAFKDVNGSKYYVATAEGLAQVADEINAGTFEGTVELTGDIDLAELMTRSAVTSNWVPVGTPEKPFSGTFDGNGFSIKNLALVETEAKEGKAYIGFFGYAKDATIKNVTFENVYINIPCLDIDHSQGHIGAVAGSLEGKSLIENVTVKGDITVYATQNANGASRVAVVAGGNSSGDVTMKNVHVIANEGSSLIANNNTGALAGQLQGKMVFENCSSNIDVTVNKFFAGGLVGIAAGDSKFVDCHTTGDVAVVAGRAGRANDHYRVGGIAGGWADGKNKVCTLENCSYTGKVSGKNADGSVAEVLDYAGYVGRGYTLTNCAGSKVVIDGFGYVQAYDNVYGVYDYEISTAAAFKAFADKVNTGNDYFEGRTVSLGADIDLNNKEWTPIGSATLDHGFCGNFDGNGYTIKNLKMTGLTPDADGFVYAGLFGVTEGAEGQENYIKNLIIENVDIQTEGHIAAAAIAYPYYTTVENVTVKGNINIKGGDYTSGVLAYTRRCVNAKDLAIIGNENSVVEGNMTVGGVISDIQTNGGLIANYSNFSASDLTVKGVQNVGGIAGIIGRQTLDGATVENVTIVCDDVRRGIVIGALGEKSTLTNVSYNNVTGATEIIGATWEKGTPVTEVDGVYKAVETIATTDALQAALADGSKASIYLAPGATFEGTFNVTRTVEIVSNANNKATIKGRVNVSGGANNEGATFKNVKFSINDASKHKNTFSGAPYQYPGIVVAYGAAMTFEGCDFETSISAGVCGINAGNHADSSDLLTVNNCTFVGDFYAIRTRTLFNITNSEFDIYTNQGTLAAVWTWGNGNSGATKVTFTGNTNKNANEVYSVQMTASNFVYDYITINVQNNNNFHALADGVNPARFNGTHTFVAGSETF